MSSEDRAVRFLLFDVASNWADVVGFVVAASRFLTTRLMGAVAEPFRQWIYEIVMGLILLAAGELESQVRLN